MSTVELQELINMLIQATNNHKIQWITDILNGEPVYKTTINDCELVFGNSYNPFEDISISNVILYNSKQEVFYKESFPEYEENGLYKEVKVLIEIIQDQLLEITVSKQKIFSKLEQLLFEK